MGGLAIWREDSGLSFACTEPGGAFFQSPAISFQDRFTGIADSPCPRLRDQDALSTCTLSPQRPPDASGNLLESVRTELEEFHPDLHASIDKARRTLSFAPLIRFTTKHFGVGRQQ